MEHPRVSARMQAAIAVCAWRMRCGGMEDMIAIAHRHEQRHAGQFAVN
jgi:hypothetical protein